MKVMASGPITSWEIDGETVETVSDFIFLGSKITKDGDCSHEKKRCLLLGRKAVTNLDSILESRDITFPTKVHIVKAMVFPIVIQMWELDHREGWVLKNWCFWNTMALKKTLESPLDSEEIKPVNPKGNQPWIFIGRTDAEAETPIRWPHDEKNRLIVNKTLMLGKTEGMRRKGWQRMGWLDGITDSMDMSLRKLQEIAWRPSTDREAWRVVVHGKIRKRLSNWTATASWYRILEDNKPYLALPPGSMAGVQLTLHIWGFSVCGFSWVESQMGCLNLGMQNIRA